MKNLLTVAAAALAIALALTGCKYENSTPRFPVPEDLWYESVSGSETVRTVNTWTLVDGFPRITAAEQTKNGAPVYRDSGFKYESSDILTPTEFTRTISLPEPATELHKNTFSDDRGLQLSAEIYRNGETSPSSWMRRQLDSSGRITRQESLENGVKTLYTNYVYGSSGYAVKYDAAVTTGETTVNTVVQEIYNSNDRAFLSQRSVLSGDNRIELELWDTNGAYEKYVGQNIIISSDGKTLSGERLVTELSAVTSTPGANDTTTQTQTRKEYDPASGDFVRQVTLRSFWQVVYVKL